MMSLGELAGAIAGASTDAPAARFASVSTDTRSLAPGALFVALQGPRFDGHDYAATACARGAAALMVQRALDVALPQLRVPDTRRALGRCATHWRMRFDLPVVAVTGSNGKTTVTQMLAAILQSAFGEQDGRARWLATRGNLNNDIGLPLMLLELTPRHRAAAFELGMNRPGEIAELAAMARPTVAMVNNAQREHQEFLDSAEATARENGAVLASLPPTGVAVFPADDPCAPIWRAQAGTRRTLEFSMHGAAAVGARFALRPDGSDLSILTPGGSIETALQVPGTHNIHNALAASACALALGIGPDAIAAGLASFRAVAGRGVRLAGERGGALIDDSYNANPDSVRAAVDLLAGQAGPRLLVLGDMGEVGARGPQFHREVGAYARERGIEQLLATGPLSVEAARAFGPGARHFEDIESLIAAVLDPASRAATILVKGSRFMRMERVVQAIAASGNGH
jgi:UDP-N-acetylmuramoyl-tripeptide--D-alanyl-D-alanine ligase